MNTNNNEVKYNDLHSTGIGYLNRARTVQPKQGKPYESVSLTAICGRVDSPSYVYYDVSVIAKALEKYLLLKDCINDPNKKVLVRFKVGDGVPDSYVTKDKEGNNIRRHIIKARMLNITWASIDGQVVQFDLTEDEPDNTAESGVVANQHDAATDHTGDVPPVV